MPGSATWPRLSITNLLLHGLVQLAMLMFVSGAAAQNIESVLRPGDVVKSHAKFEDDCAQCHVKFDRAAQDRLCMDCHKDVAVDVRSRGGYHGRVKPQACRSCHTEHKGRAADIMPLDKRNFDHTLTDFALKGGHLKTECVKCHAPTKRYREAPVQCNACHRKDDVHKGSLGTDCASCHTDGTWKETVRFDHGKTRFSLSGKHADVKCADCHKKGADYKDAPRTCVGCHKKDDDGARGHKGRYGDKCESCHGTKAWKPATFNHDTETKYALRGKHRAAECGECHTGHLYKQKLGTACIDCHKKDDDGAKGHKGNLGKDCAACHSEAGWKEKGRFDHAKTQFPLLGKHVDAKCTECHKSTRYKEAPKDCIGCHKADDKHEATLGTRCESCHNERSWKTLSRFDHDKTRFQLRNAHAAKKVQCKDCHASLKQYRDTSMQCDACHKKDDKHEGQLGKKCESCHTDRDWKVPRFNHSQTRFALLGKHTVANCADCHKTLRYKDAPRDCYSCHRKEDRHELKFGTACESCHNARAWGIWDFDHKRRARYALEGAHAKVACERCHTRPAPSGKAAAELGTHCAACHRRDDPHDGSFGPACEQCHSVDSWKRVRTRVGAALPDPALGQWALGHASALRVSARSELRQ